MNFPTRLSESFRNAPFAWIAALAAAALPFMVVAMKGSTPTSIAAAAPVTTRAPSTASSGGVSDWFSGADNPFLTEEQSRERRLRASVGRVEDVIRRRPDVREVTILATAGSDGRGSSAVVSISMREGVVPIQLVDAAGTLLSAAVPGLHADRVTVIDEPTGIQARACTLGSEADVDGRKALALAQTAPRPVPSPSAAVDSVTVVANGAWPAWVWAGGIVLAAVVAWSLWFWRTRRMEVDEVPIVTEEDPIAGTLSMALHRGVAEQGALITTALVERLEQGVAANEVAQLLLSIEPWAAERLLKGMPPEALAKVEEALRDPAHDAPMESVRALAEAVLSVRAAA